MDRPDFTPPDCPDEDFFSLSWVAYVRPAILFSLLAAIGLIVSQSARDATLILVGYGILFFAIVKLIGDIALRRRVLFYYDREGVWLYRGVTFWNKGVSGLPWTDITDASYSGGLFSVLTQSYSVRVEHHDQPEKDIVLAHIKHGKQAIAVINRKLTHDFFR